MAVPDFPISSQGAVSTAFTYSDINSFVPACNWIMHLPYGRNRDKTDLLTVFADQCGTCSTKHALLKQLAEENEFEGIRLMLGIYRMNGHNTPPAARVLQESGLVYIPEAHNYLRFNGHVLDYTAKRPLDFLPNLLEETEIRPDQITDFKVNLHKSYLENWRQQVGLTYTLDELWAIREACIAALAGI